MPSSSHIDASPRTELLSPPSSLTQSQSSSSGRVRPPGGRSRGWRERERELLRNKLSQRELVRLIIDSERESAKLHSTLSNTVNLLDEESRKCAALERDAFSNFTRFNSARETALATADGLARDLRVARFELEHARREAERLNDEAEAQKKFREELEAEYIKMKDMAHKYKRERLMDLARNEGRREGFEAGFQQAQAEGYMKREKEDAATAEASAQRRQRLPPPSALHRPPPPSSTLHRPQRDEAPVIPSPPRPSEESPFEEMPSIPIVTPPEQTIPPDRGHYAPTHTGYSPKRPVPRSRPPVDRSNVASPSIDHYEVSIPPQHIIEQTTNINQPTRAEPKSDWVTGPQHRDINGQTPDVPTGNFTASSEDRHPPPPPPPHVRETSTVDNTTYEPEPDVPNQRYIQPQGNKPRVKFRRPTLKQAAASWYRTLSFRKKPRQKVVIDPADGDSGPISPTSPTEAETEHGHGPETFSVVVPGPVPVSNRPPAADVQSNKRHSKSASFAASATRPEGYPQGTGRRHRPGASMDSIPMSQFDMLATPLPTADAGYPRDGGTANVSAASLVSNGVLPSGKSQAQSISGRSAKSQGNGIGKKLSVIKENPLSRNSTPLRPITPQDNNRVQVRSPQLYKRPSALEDRRSMRSGKSTGSRMFAVNPDPESPDLVGQGQAPPAQIYSQQPPPGSSLHHYTSGNLPAIAPLRTKKSGLSVASRGSPLETPTPMPRIDKGKGRELIPPETSKSDGSGINITIQTPSDPGQGTPQLGYFMSSRKSPRNGSPLSHSTPRLTPSNTLSATQPQDGVTSSTPKIFQAQNLPEKDPNEENVFIPRVTIRKRIGPDGVFTVNNAGMTPGLVLHQPLPSHVPQVQPNIAGGPVPVAGNLGADLAAGLHRAGSSSSLRSQGAYGKFDPSTYQDPAIWGAPPGAFGHDRPRSDTSSRRLSYADTHNEG